MKKIAYFVLVSLLLFSCKNDVSQTETKTPQQSGLIVDDTLNILLSNGIPVPKTVYYRDFNSNGFSFTYPSKDYVFLYNYYLDKNKWEIKKLPLEGPDAVIKPGYYKRFTSPAKFLYFPNGVNKLLIFDKNYKLEKKYDFVEGYTLPFPKRFNCYLNNDIVYFPSLSQDAYVNFKNFINTKLITKIDLKTGKKEQIVKVPGDFYQYQSKTMYDISPEFVFPDESSIVFITRKSPFIYKYDISTNKTEKYKYPNEHIQYSKDDIKLGHKNTGYMYEKGYYHSIIFDKKNKKYYRLSEFNDNPGKDNPGGKYNKTRIDVFDESFNYLSHRDFDNLNPDYCFVNNDGLYLLLKKQEKENFLTFYHISMGN